MEIRLVRCVLLTVLLLGWVDVTRAEDCTGDGSERVQAIGEGSGVVCAEEDGDDDDEAYVIEETRRVRAERRASVAAMGTFVALMSAAAMPSTFVPLGIAKIFNRLDITSDDRYERLRHNAYRARVRYLPITAMTALSVSSLSSRFWWAGVLTAGAGISADVLLAMHWRNGGDDTKRAVGIAAASVAAVAGLILNVETLAYSDVGTTPRFAFMPTLHIGAASVELGMGGRF